MGAHTIGEQLRKYISNGGDFTIEPDGEYYVPYDEVQVEQIDGEVALKFTRRNVCVAHIECTGQSRTVSTVDGRLKVPAS